MNAYIIYNENNKVVAYTDNKEILETYLFNINKSTSKQYSFKKVKYKRIKDNEDYDNLYLVRFNDTYIPSKFYKYMELEDSNEGRRVVDYLMKNLEIRELSEKKRKLVEKMILLVEKWHMEDKEYTPDNEELEKLEDHYQPYLEKWYEC